MQGVWAGFAKNPSGGVGWPKLGSNFGKELGVLGGEKKPKGERTARLSEADYPCALYSTLNVASGMAY